MGISRGSVDRAVLVAVRLVASCSDALHRLLFERVEGRTPELVAAASARRGGMAGHKVRSRGLVRRRIVEPIESPGGIRCKQATDEDDGARNQHWPDEGARRRQGARVLLACVHAYCGPGDHELLRREQRMSLPVQ